jgi:curved DNA-binding protein CbpA
MKALKYHPDRNPGREAEFNAKFQAIQAANEILSDPQQRLKYDTDRLRAGYGKVYGPPKANTQRKSQPRLLLPQTTKISRLDRQPGLADTRHMHVPVLNNGRNRRMRGKQGLMPSGASRI